MSKIKYDANLLKVMNLFETLTKTRLKDCFYDDNDLLTFVVNDTQIGKAIGKKAANVKRLEKLLKRKIKIVAFNSNPVQFVKNLIYPLTADVNFEEKIITITSQDTKTKGFIIGRNQSNLNNTLNIIQKYFKNIEQIKVP